MIYFRETSINACKIDYVESSICGYKVTTDIPELFKQCQSECGAFEWQNISFLCMEIR